MTVKISALRPDDRARWEGLYRGYAAFYEVPMTTEILDKVWSWIFDTGNPFFALIAKNESGEALGLMHFREMPSPLRGTVVGFLDDLFVKPEHRGGGCVQALYKALNDFGKDRGWPFIRWITADNNYRGRASYDRIATRTHWITYQMQVE
jgi:GNAT superfamily N-acetyltransferase